MSRWSQLQQKPIPSSDCVPSNVIGAKRTRDGAPGMRTYFKILFYVDKSLEERDDSSLGDRFTGPTKITGGKNPGKRPTALADAVQRITKYK